MLRSWARDREFLPWVIIVTMVTLAFFLGLSLFVENPFARLWATANGHIIKAMFQPAGAVPFTPRDGNGLNPLLRHPGMILHPPFLYSGFVAFIIPYAFAMASLVTGRTDARWIRLTRRWSLAAWLFLSLGLILGMRWSYDVLGWGGYWGWDPVEVAALLPWLTGTAFLHSVMIQEKEGLLKHWNMVLIILTYALVIFGTFLTRSGVLSSVHAFAQSAVGPLFFGFIGITFTLSLYLLTRRWNNLKSDLRIESLLSREALFTFNNLVFMGIVVVAFWGVIFPILSELVTGQKVTVGPPFYQKATGPLFALLLLLMGIAPLSAWGYANARRLKKMLIVPVALALLTVGGLTALLGIHSVWALVGFALVAFTGYVTIGEFIRGVRARMHRGEAFPTAFVRLMRRNRRRYGGYIVHLGIIVMATGIIGTQFFATETQATVPQGGKITLGHYAMTYDGLQEFFAPDGRHVARAIVSVYKDGRKVGVVHPRRDFYVDSQQPMTIPGVRSSLLGDDFYVILVDWQPISVEGATFKVYHQPLVNWIWMGALIFIIGTLVAAWPEADPDTAARRSRTRASEAAQASTP
jgi:cytochrome c-type biogenesis protein CcmF